MCVWHLERTNADTIMFSTHPTRSYSCGKLIFRRNRSSAALLKLCVFWGQLKCSFSTKPERNTNLNSDPLSLTCTILSLVVSECTDETTVIQSIIKQRCFCVLLCISLPKCVSCRCWSGYLSDVTESVRHILNLVCMWVFSLTHTSGTISNCKCTTLNKCHSIKCCILHLKCIYLGRSV